MQRSLLTCLCALVASGCYTFQPTGMDEVAPGQSVRARVTGTFADSLQTMIGRGDRVFEGVLVERQGSSSLLEIPVQQALQGMRFQTLSQRVEVPDAAVVEIENKELNRGRTYAGVAVAAVVLGAVIVMQINKDSGGAQRPGRGGPQDAKVSLSLAGISRVLGR